MPEPTSPARRVFTCSATSATSSASRSATLVCTTGSQQQCRSVSRASRVSRRRRRDLEPPAAVVDHQSPPSPSPALLIQLLLLDLLVALHLKSKFEIHCSTLFCSPPATAARSRLCFQIHCSALFCSPTSAARSKLCIVLHLKSKF